MPAGSEHGLRRRVHSTRRWRDTMGSRKTPSVPHGPRMIVASRLAVLAVALSAIALGASVTTAHALPETTSPPAAQAGAQEMEELRAEIRELREQIRALQEQMKLLQPQQAALGEQRAPTEAPAPAELPAEPSQAPAVTPAR